MKLLMKDGLTAIKFVGMNDLCIFTMSTSLHLVVLLTLLYNTEYCNKEKLTGSVSKKHNGCCLPPDLTGYEKLLDLESHSTSKPH